MKRLGWTLGLFWLWSAAAGAAPVQWFDGQHMQTAWVNAQTGEVAMVQGGPERPLAKVLVVEAQSGQGAQLASELQALGFDVSRSPQPDQLYLPIPADQALAATVRMAQVKSIAGVTLQWASRARVPSLQQ